MVRFKSFQEWSKRQGVEKGMKEAYMDQRIGVQPVH